MCLSKNIRYLRKKLNLSQEALAQRFGYKSFTNIKKWEMGTSEPPAGIVKKLAELFNVDIDDLMKIDLEDAELHPKAHKFYIDKETMERAQTLFDSEEMRLLFDAAKDSKPEDLQMAADLLQRLKGTNPDG